MLMWNHYTPLQWSWKGGILVSRRPSVSPSVCQSVCGQNCVCSVSSTILAGSISYLHILSSNFRKCVACKGHCKIFKFEFLAIFLNMYFWLCLIMTWDLIWINSMGNHGAVGVFTECRHSSYVLNSTESELWNDMVVIYFIENIRAMSHIVWIYP